MALFVHIFDGTRICYDLQSVNNSIMTILSEICDQKGYPKEDLRVYHHGRLIQANDGLQENGSYHVTLSLPGGKGGFGAMLRMIGAQIEKTTNHEACRDLSGRRMRDVNNEKKLQAWIEQKKKQEEEREKRRREKLERMRSTPKHYFVDPSYDKQREAVTESLDEAVSTGIDVAGSSTNGASGGTKRKADSDSDEDDLEEDKAELKKICMWLGIDADVDADVDDEEDDAEKTNSTSNADKEILVNDSQSSTTTSSSSSASPVEEGSAVETPTGDENAETATKASPESKSLLSSLPPPATDRSSLSKEEGPINLDEYSSSADLEQVGLDRLKIALMERGMKCGGTLQERAQRLFSVKGLEPSQIDPSLLAKPSKGKKGKKK